MEALLPSTKPRSQRSRDRVIALVSALAISGQAVLPLLHEVTAHGHFDSALDHSHDRPCTSSFVSVADSLPSETRIEADCPVCLALSTARHSVAPSGSPTHTSPHFVSAGFRLTLRDLWVSGTVDLNLAAPRAPPA